MSIQNYIWYEKYRPKSLNSLALSTQYRKNFAEYLENGEIPHLLFYGPPGSGKTTIAMIFLESLNCVKLVLNASSEDRGIATIKTKITRFAQSQTMDNKLKIVFLDEADGLTRDAQTALKNTMETYSKNCRFILTCNEIDKIELPIKSRCTPYEFTIFPISQTMRKMEIILKAENIEYDITGVKKIVDQYYPDIRSIVNMIQYCSIGGKLSIENIGGITVDLNKILDLILEGEIGKIRSILSKITDFTWIYRFLFDTLLLTEDLSSEEKTMIVGILADSLYRDSSVANREINFVSCCVDLMGVLKCQKISFQS